MSKAVDAFDPAREGWHEGWKGTPNMWSWSPDRDLWEVWGVYEEGNLCRIFRVQGDIRTTIYEGRSLSHDEIVRRLVDAGFPQEWDA